MARKIVVECLVCGASFRDHEQLAAHLAVLRERRERYGAAWQLRGLWTYRPDPDVIAGGQPDPEDEVI